MGDVVVLRQRADGSDPAARLEGVLAWMRGPVSTEALLPVVCGAALSTGRSALDSLVENSRLVVDDAGWVRLNPVFRRRPEPAAAPLARRVVARACAADPADLSLQVTRLCLTSWDDPAAVDRTRDLLERVRWGLRARELVDMLDDADLLGTLYGVAPRALVALLIEGGRVEQARPLPGPGDIYLRALLALEEQRVDEARDGLRDGVGLAVRFLRMRVCQRAFDYEALAHELSCVPAEGLSPLDTLKRAFFAHRLHMYRGDWDRLPALYGAMCAAAEQTGDESLMGRVVEAELTRAVRRGEVAVAKGLWAELERLLGLGWAPGLRSRLALHAAYIADLEGHHLDLEAALARPYLVEAGSFVRRLKEAGLWMLRGRPLQGLAVPEVARSPGSRAQYLAEVGRFGEALVLVDARPPGYCDRDLQVLRGPIAGWLGTGVVVEPDTDASPYQACKLCWANTVVELQRGGLAEARGWVDRGLDLARRWGLWGLGARLLVLRADVACREGDLAAATSDLDRLDALQLHPDSFRLNMARAARLRMAGEAPAPDFVARLVTCADRLTLGVLAADHPVGVAALALLEDLSEAVSDHLEASFVEPAARTVLTIDPSGRMVALPGGRILDLRRSGAPRRVLLALLHQRRTRPGVALDADALIALGWPDENMLWESARTRLYTVVRRLRAGGVEHLETVDGGYRIRPGVEVVVGPVDPVPTRR